ncbi:MAG TPA: hypothetical protein VIL00_01260 [Pseudonocardiaceae bacterium]
MPWSYWHRVEYFRIERGARVLVDTEDIDDHGPYLGRGGPEEYARLCAEDYLDRREAPPGRWLVVLWRLDQGRKSRRLCETEVHWPGGPAARQKVHQENTLTGPGGAR